jgi:hypothetical protein
MCLKQEVVVRPLVLLAAVVLVVSPAFAKSTTSTALSASPQDVIHGNTVTLTATVTTSGSSQPTGTVNFLVGTGLLGSGTLSGGTVSLSEPTSTVALGSYEVHAVYAGDTANSGSTSPILTVAVQSATTTTFSLSPDDIQQGQPVVLIAHVARVGNAGNATGTVTFFYGTEVVTTADLGPDGGAILQVSSSGVTQGSYALTAHYNGDTEDAASTSTITTANVTPAVDVLMHRNNSARTGLQPAETVLTLANVNATTFGKLYTFTTDGYTYAQPLFISNINMSDGKQHNVLYIFNETGTIYAFDADNNNPSAGYLWKGSIVPSGEQVVAVADYFNCSNPNPHAGIIGTPVIDRARKVIYVIGKTKLVSGSTTTYIQRLHALSLVDGAEMLNGPTVIAATFPGTGYGSSGGVVSFGALAQNARAAMLEANGSVWISWASHCDASTYHGWTIGYNVNNISQQTGVFNNTPNGNQGGIWMVQGGMAADNAGNLFTVAGNGTFDADDAGGDYSDTAQRLVIGNGTLTPADYFTPTNEAYLSENDLDFGTADPLLFDDPASGVAPFLLATADKTGRVYLLNRYNLGGFDTGAGSTNGDLQDFTYGSQIFVNFGYFNHRVYIGAGGEPLGAFDYTPGTANTAGFLATTPSMTTSVTFIAGHTNGGLQPMFSANGTANAIVWGFDENTRTLYAWDANNLATQLYSSATNSSRDQPPMPEKMTVPIIANGHVFVAGQGTVAVYGLLP